MIRFSLYNGTNPSSRKRVVSSSFRGADSPTDPFGAKPNIAFEAWGFTAPASVSRIPFSSVCPSEKTS